MQPELLYNFGDVSKHGGALSYVTSGRVRVSKQYVTILATINSSGINIFIVV